MKCFIHAEEGTTLPVEFFSTLAFPSTNVSFDWRMVGCVIWKPSGRSLTPDDLMITALCMASGLNGHLPNKYFSYILIEGTFYERTNMQFFLDVSNFNIYMYVFQHLYLEFLKKNLYPSKFEITKLDCIMKNTLFQI